MLQCWESQLPFGCECCWQYSLLCGLQYSCCIDLLPLLFLISSSRVVTQAGPPWSCGKAGCPPCRGKGSLSIVYTLLWSFIIYLGPVTAFWLIAPPFCVSPLELCISVSSLFLCLPILNILSNHVSGDRYLSSTKGQVLLCTISHLSCLSLPVCTVKPKGDPCCPSCNF